MIRTLFTAVLLCSGWCSAHAAQRRLLLLGGGDKAWDSMGVFADWAGGPKARILGITWASGEPQEYFDEFEASVRTSSPAAVEHAVSTEALKGRKQEFLAQLSRASAVFFCGGDQNRVSALLKEHPDVRAALHKRYQEGVPFGGHSAGTAIMSELMITGEGDFSVIDAAQVGVDQGLGLLPNAIVDQHFIARKRLNRLFSLVLAHPDLLGIGVDEPAALAVEDERVAEVVTPGQVMMVQGAEGRRLILDLLQRGDRYDLQKRKRL